MTTPLPVINYNAIDKPILDKWIESVKSLGTPEKKDEIRKKGLNNILSDISTFEALVTPINISCLCIH